MEDIFTVLDAILDPMEAFGYSFGTFQLSCTTCDFSSDLVVISYGTWILGVTQVFECLAVRAGVNCGGVERAVFGFGD